MKNSVKKNPLEIMLIVTAVLIVLCIAFAIWFAAVNSINVNTVVGSVNGINFYAGEVKLLMNLKKSDVINHFSKEYGVNYSNETDFWNTEYTKDKITPLEYLQKAVLDDIIRNKLEMNLSAEYGLQINDTYSDFLEELSSVNADNSRKVANNMVVYGQKKYSEAEYYKYKLSNLRLDLQGKMSEKGKPLYADKDTLKQFYEKNKDELYKKTDTFSLKLFEIELSDNEQNAVQIMKNVKKAVENAKKIEYAESSIEKDYPAVKIYDYKLDNENASEFSKANRNLFEKILELSSGDVTDTVRSEAKLHLAYCVERNFGGYKSFESLYSNIVTDYSAAAFNQYVDDLVKNAKVVTYSEFSKIPINEELK